MGQPKLPTKEELSGYVAELFHGSGWVVNEVWMEWWSAARYVRLMVEPADEMADGSDGVFNLAYELRRQMLEQTGMSWVVVLYTVPLSPRDHRRIVKRMAQRFG
jgi:hypothetical protein